MSDYNPKATVNAKTDMGSDFDFSSYGMAQLPKPATPNYEIGVGDGLRAVAKGATDGAQGLTEVVEQGGKYIDNAAESDSPIKSAIAKAYQNAPHIQGARKVAELWNDGLGAVSQFIEGSMSDDAKSALSAPVASKGEDGAWSVSDDPAVWAMQLSQSIGYMAPTAVAAIATGGAASSATAARLLPKIAGLAVKAGARPEIAAKAAQLVVNGMRGSTAVGVGMASDLGSQGVQARDGVMNASLEQLATSDTFRNEFLAVDTNPEYSHLSDPEKIDIARQNVADMASRATSSDAKNIATSALATALGDVPLLNAVMKGGKSATKLGAGAAQGFVREGATEALQEGTQQYVSNEVSNKYAGTNLDPWDGVDEAAVSGGLLGGVSGGGLGAVGSLRSTGQQNSDIEGSSNVVHEGESASGDIWKTQEAPQQEPSTQGAEPAEPVTPGQDSQKQEEGNTDVLQNSSEGDGAPNPADFGLTPEQAEMLVDPDPEMVDFKPIKKGSKPTAEQVKQQQQADAYKRELKRLQNSDAGKAYFNAEQDFRYGIYQEKQSLRQATGESQAKETTVPGGELSNTNVIQNPSLNESEQVVNPQASIDPFDASIAAEAEEFDRRAKVRKENKVSEYSKHIEQGRDNVRQAKDQAYLDDLNAKRYGEDYQPSEAAKSIRQTLGLDQQELQARDRGDIKKPSPVVPAQPAIDAVQAKVAEEERQRNLDYTSAKIQKREQEDKANQLRRTGSSKFTERSGSMKLREQGRKPIAEIDVDDRMKRIRKRMKKRLSKIRKSQPQSADAILEQYRNHEKRLSAYAESARQRAEAEANKPENVARRKSVEALFQEQMAKPEAKEFRKNAIAQAIADIDAAAWEKMGDLSEAEKADVTAEVAAIKESARISLNQLASQLADRKGVLLKRMIDKFSKPDLPADETEKGSTDVIQNPEASEAKNTDEDLPESSSNVLQDKPVSGEENPDQVESSPESNDPVLTTARQVIEQVFTENDGSLKGVRNAYKAAGVSAKDVDSAVKRAGIASSVSTFERQIKAELQEKGSSNVVQLDEKKSDNDDRDPDPNGPKGSKLKDKSQTKEPGNDSKADATRPDEGAERIQSEVSANASESTGAGNRADGETGQQSDSKTSSDGNAGRDSQERSDQGDTTTRLDLDTVPDIASGTDSERVAANLDAIRLMKELVKSGTPATIEQKQSLAKYVGWGGLAFVFDSNTNRKYAQAADAELRKLLTETEYNQIRESTRNAFYTSKPVVKGMWAGVKAFGLGDKSMNVVEPSLGSGNFIGWQPETMRDLSRWSAAELDTVTGNIAKLIYPEANIQVKGFQETPFKSGVFSLAIGNPPFGSQPIHDKKHPDISGMSVHNYIIAKSGKLLHANGLMMMVVTNRFLDTKNKNHRELSKSLDFVGAIRLPNTAFKSNAGTEVTTDIVVFRKLADGETAKNTIWTDVDGEVNGVRINKWFEKNPQYILGEVSGQGTMYSRDGDELTVNPTDEHSDIERSITHALEQLADGQNLAMTDEQVDQLAGEVMLEESDLPVGGLMVDADGNIRRRMDDRPDGSAQVHTVSPETIWSDDGMLLSMAEHYLGNPDVLQQLANDKLLTKNGKLKTEYTNAKYKKVAFSAVVDYLGGKIDESQAQKLIQDGINHTRLGDAKYQKLKGMLELRNTTLELLRAEKQDRPEIEALRKRLNQQYDAFVKANSTKGKMATVTANLGLLNGDLGIESGLDDVNAKGKVRKHDIFTSRMVYPYHAPTSAENVDDAVNYSIQERGRVDVPYIAELMGVLPVEARSRLYEGERPYLLLDPVTGEDVFIDDYLAGNVKRKYQEALDAGLEVNAKLLKRVLPKDKPKEKVRPSIRASWMDKEVFQEFLGAMGLNADVLVVPQIGAIRITGLPEKVADTELSAQFKHDRASLTDLFEAAAAGKSLVIYDRVNSDSTVKNEKATKEVNALANKMAKAFQTWAENDPEIHQRIADNFNARINTHIERKFNGRLYLKTVGQSPAISLRKTQLDGALRMIQSKNTLLDHTVGAGKTFTAITGVMQRKRLGLSKKPVMVVPNHIIGAFKNDFFALYPGANVLAVSEKDFSAKNRKKFFSKIATGNYDAIIIGHSHLRFMPNDMDMFEAVINEKIAELRDALEKAKQDAKDAGRRGSSVKQIEDSISRLKEKIKAKQEAIKEKGDSIGFNFSDLGVDYMVIDEAHEFKNLTYSTRSDRVVGMNDPKGSEKALDLLIKTRSVQAISNGGVTYMTGTPVSNSLVEIYTMMYYLGYDDLKEKNISFYDAFAGSFINTEIAMEYTATGTVKERRVLKGLNSMQELSTLYRQFADVITHTDMLSIYAEDVAESNAAKGENKSTRFPVPNVKGGQRQLNIAPATDAQREYNDYLIARMEAIEGISGKDERQEYAKLDNPLWVLTDAKKASLDVRLVDPGAHRDPTGKIARAGTEIKRLYDKWGADKGTQLVFSDMGTPAKYAKTNTKKELVDLASLVMPAKAAREYVSQRMAFYGDSSPYSKTLVDIEEKINTAVEFEELDGEKAEKAQDAIKEAASSALTADTGFSVYDDLKAALIEQGIPEHEIAFIHDYNTVDKKAALFAQVNAGEVRVLIGSSAKMGAGTNAQERLVGLHHMDAPWRPSDMEQREGRIIRQGNSLYQRAADTGKPDDFEVEILAYATQGSSDPVMWQILERKAGAIEQFRSGELDEFVENGGDSDSYAEFKAASTGNPIYKLKLESDAELLDVESDYMAKASSKGSAERIVGNYEQRKAQMTTQKNLLEKAKVTAFDVLQFKEQRDVALAEYNQAMSDFEAATLEYEELSPEERKAKKITRPKQPTKPRIYQLDNQYSQQLNKQIIQPGIEAMKAGKSWDGELPLGDSLSLVVTIDPVRTGEEGTFRIDVDYTDGSGEILVDSGQTYAKTLTGSGGLIHSMSLTAIQSAVDKNLAQTSRAIKQLDSGFADAKTLAKIDLKSERQRYDEVKDRNLWLTTEAKLADIKEDLRRSETPNKYIDQESRRKVKRSTFDPSKIKPEIVTFKDVEYKTLGVKLPAPNWQYDGVMPALDGNGHYVHLLLSNDSKPDNLVVDSVYSQPAGTPSPEYQFLEDAKAKAEDQGEADSAVRFSKRVRDNGVSPGIVNGDNTAFVNGVVDSILASMEGLDPDLRHAVKIVDTESSLPKPIQDAIDSYDAHGEINGVYYKGNTYLVADKLHTRASVEETLLHEFIGHFGLRKLFEGKPLTAELNRIAKKIGSEKRLLELARELGIDLSAYVESENKLLWQGERSYEQRLGIIVDELLAHMAGRKQFATNITRLVVWLKEKLRALGFKELGRYGKAELMSLVSEAQKAATGKITPYADIQSQNKQLNKRYMVGYKGDDIRFSRQAYNQPLPGETLQDIMAAQEKSLVSAIKRGISKFPGSDKLRQNKYAFLTLRQLSEVGDKYLPMIKGYVKSVNQMQATQNYLAEAVADLTTEVSDWAKKNKAKADQLFDMMHQATLAGVDPSKPFESMAEILQKEADYLARRIKNNNAEANIDLVKRRNDILEAIKAEPNRRKEHARMREKYSKLPADSKRHFEAMRDHYVQQRERMREALETSIKRAQMEEAVRKEMLRTIRFDNERASKELYFPLGRFGDYWIDVADENGERQFMMFETQVEMEEAKAALERKGYSPKSGQKLVESQAVGGASIGFVSDVINNIKSMKNLGDKYKEQLADDIYQLYLRAMPERSIRKAFIHRKGVSGFSQDAVRVMADQGFKQSRQQARLEHMDDLEGYLEAMREQAKGGGDVETARIYNEMVQRHEWVKNPARAAWAQKLTGAGFVWMLGLSPAAALINLTQNLQVALPILGSKYGMGEASRQMSIATGEFLKALPRNVKPNRNRSQNGIIGTALKGRERDAMRAAILAGAIDTTQAADLVGLAENPSAQYNGYWNKAMNIIGWSFHHAEVFNREVTFMAAYRLAYNKSKDHDSAVTEAINATWDSHFDYGSLNRARFMQGDVAAVALQFKQYSQNMTYYLYSNLLKSFKKGTPKADRDLARKQLMWTMATTFAIGGMGALPLSAITLPMMVAQALFGDDDDPFEPEVEIKKMLSEFWGPDVAASMWYGVAPNVSNRISLNELWWRSSDREMAPDEWYLNALQQLSGPVIGGIGLSAAWGLKDLQEGYTSRGIEKLTPKAVKDMLKTARYYHEDGVLSKHGDPVVDELSWTELGAQFVGFTPGRVVKQYDQNSAQKNAEMHVNNRRQSLLSAYYMAYRNGDQESMREVLLKIGKYNRSEWGRKNPITGENIKRSIRRRAMNLAEMENGMKLDKKFRKLAKEMQYFTETP